MKKYIVHLLCLLLSFSYASTSGSASLSCSGTVQLCSHCSSEYFYIYSYQYAYVYGGEVKSESHSSSMSGFLGDSSKYTALPRASDRHIMYTNGKETIAVPYQDSNDGIWIDGEGLSAPGEAPATWIKLCPN